MTWTPLDATVLPLAGVVLGAAGTLLGQHLVLRVDLRRDAAQREAAQRAERKEAIIGFLSAAERIEQHRGEAVNEPGRDGARLSELMHEAWLAKKIVELVCSGDLAQAAQDYTRALNEGSREYRRMGQAGQTVPLSYGERQLRATFIEAARREMGYAGEPLRRRAIHDRQQQEPRREQAPEPIPPQPM